MNGTRSLFTEFITKLNNNKITSDVVVCPPFTAFPGKIELKGNIKLGAQNCHYKQSGSYTGEVSVEMIKELGCTYVILGHSERNETDDETKLKAELVIESDLCPIICVGEKLEDRESGKAKKIIESQCKSRLPINGEYIIAYEPVWAIGTGCIPDNDIISDVIDTAQLYTNYRPVIYGGSVNLENIGNLLNICNLSGVLIGSASLNCDGLLKIVEKIEKFF